MSHLLLLLLCHFHTLLLIYNEMSASCERVTVHTTDFSPKLHVFSLTVSLCLLHCCCAVAIHTKQSLCLSRARGRPHVSEFHHGFAGSRCWVSLPSPSAEPLCRAASAECGIPTSAECMLFCLVCPGLHVLPAHLSLSCCRVTATGWNSHWVLGLIGHQLTSPG